MGIHLSLPLLVHTAVLPSAEIMKLFVVLCLATLSLASAASKYNGYEQPGYTVLESNSNYELRSYPATLWASTDVSGATFDSIGSMAFWRLFGYISGGNSGSRKIDMTVPVITTMRERPCAFCDNSYAMSFFLPADVASDAPSPSDSAVSLTNMPATQVYVKRFGGFANNDDWMTQASQLHSELQRDGVSDDQIHTGHFFAAGYDSPWRIMYRRNEVWIVKV